MVDYGHGFHTDGKDKTYYTDILVTDSIIVAIISACFYAPGNLLHISAMIMLKHYDN